MTTALTLSGQDEIAAVVRQEMERWAVPGVAVGIFHDGRIETWGFGVASIETGQTLRPDTIFQAGSISKVFTATLGMRLVDDGTLDLDLPVARYLPDLQLADPVARERVTLRHLFSHQAGFYGDRFADYGLGDDALSRAIAEFASLRQLTPPGELWTYCNTGFQLAGGVIERVLGQSFEVAMREQVLEPLGLTRSFYFAHEAITYPVAVGHNQSPGQPPRVARLWARHRARAPQGGLLTTVGDLLRFAAFHMGDGSVNGTRLLTAASIQAMQAPQVEAGSFADWYGLGWALRRFGTTAVPGHGGSTNGFRAGLALVPAQRFAVAVLTNSDEGTAVVRAIEAWALAHFTGLKRVIPPPVNLSLAALQRFAGRYMDPLMDAVVRVSGSGLCLETVHRSPWTGEPVAGPLLEAVPVGDCRFLITTEGASAGETVDFIPSEGDTIRFMRLHGRLADRLG